MSEAPSSSFEHHQELTVDTDTTDFETSFDGGERFHAQRLNYKLGKNAVSRLLEDRVEPLAETYGQLTLEQEARVERIRSLIGIWAVEASLTTHQRGYESENHANDHLVYGEAALIETLEHGTLEAADREIAEILVKIHDEIELLPYSDMRTDATIELLLATQELSVAAGIDPAAVNERAATLLYGAESRTAA